MRVSMFGAFFFLLFIATLPSSFTCSSIGPSKHHNDEPSAIMVRRPRVVAKRARYRYEGPDGCNTKKCSCTTDSIVQPRNVEDGIDVEMTIKTLKCQEIPDAYGPYLAFRISELFSNLKGMAGEIWDKVATGFRQVAAFLRERGDVYTSGMSEYLNKIKTNIQTAYKSAVNKTNQQVALQNGETIKMVETDIIDVPKKGHAENLANICNNNNNEPCKCSYDL